MPVARHLFNAAHAFKAEPGPDWIYFSVTQGPSDIWGAAMFLNGDWLSTFNDTQKLQVLEAGVPRSWILDIAQVNYPHPGTPPLVTACGSIPAPGGVTRIFGLSQLDTGDFVALNPANVTLEVQEAGGSVVLAADGVHCSTDPAGLGTRYSFVR